MDLHVPTSGSAPGSNEVSHEVPGTACIATLASVLLWDSDFLKLVMGGTPAAFGFPSRPRLTIRKFPIPSIC